MGGSSPALRRRSGEGIAALSTLLGVPCERSWLGFAAEARWKGTLACRLDSVSLLCPPHRTRGPRRRHAYRIRTRHSVGG